MSNAILNKRNLRNYQVIPGVGTFKAKVANTVKPEYIYGDGDKARYIVNLRCATTDGFKECLGIMANKETISFDSVRQCFMSGALWDSDLDDLTILPIKGEEVIATFDYVDGRLLCTALTLIPRKELDNFDIDAYCKSRNLLKKLLT